MRKERSNSGAMVVVTILVMMTGGILSGATEDVSGATKVDLYASEVDTDSVKLTWTESDDWLFDRYEIYMDDGNGWRLLKTYQSKNSLEYRVTGLESGTTYTFKIRDKDEISYADSDTVMITTDKAGVIPALPVTGILVAIVGVALVVSARRKKIGET